MHHLNPKETEMFIFGSQANLKKFKQADIDVGIKPKRALTLKKLAQIQNELEEIETLRPIDLVDFSAVDEDFKHVALSNIERL